MRSRPPCDLGLSSLDQKDRIFLERGCRMKARPNGGDLIMTPGSRTFHSFRSAVDSMRSAITPGVLPSSMKH